MGTCLTKITSRRREKRKSFREWRSGSQRKAADKHEAKDSTNNEGADKSSNNQNNVEGSARTRKTLKELAMDPPPGFRKFESEVDWKTVDEDIAFQLWEDIFKPLYTF